MDLGDLLLCMLENNNILYIFLTFAAYRLHSLQKCTAKLSECASKKAKDEMPPY